MLKRLVLPLFIFVLLGLGCEQEQVVGPTDIPSTDVLSAAEMTLEETNANSDVTYSYDSWGDKTITTRAFITERFGGKLRIPRATFLYVPPHAVSENMWITSTVTLRQVMGRVDTLIYKFTPEHFTFDLPATLVIYFFRLDAVEEDTISLFLFNEGIQEWELVDEATVEIDHRRKRISFEIDNFTMYAIARTRGLIRRRH